jgi:K(+)-stimulated pyrophosphate-energized sodium pump
MSLNGFARHVVSRFAPAATFFLCLLSAPLSLLAAESDSAEAIAAHSAGNTGMVIGGWAACLFGALLALFFARRFFMWMVEQDEGDERMITIAEHVRKGADAYLRQQYRIVAVFFMFTCVLLAVVAFVFNAQSEWVPFAFVTGGFYSGLAGWFGMKTATLASSRTAAAAKNSLNQGLQVAFRSGAVMGLVVVGLGLLDICVWFAVLNWVYPALPGGHIIGLEEVTVTMLCFGMGASSQALFARVGGGIFTKAADVGADLVGKVEAGIPEDDPRNPATIADNVGDNVGDVAGMGADLYESYCGSILASAALGVAAFSGYPTMQYMMVLLPMLLAACGIVVSIFGIYMVRTEEGATQRNLLGALGRGINVSSALVVVVAAGLVYLLLVGPSSRIDFAVDSVLPRGNALFGVFGAIVTGLAAGMIIGRWTEYSTSAEYAPTKRIADQGVTGPATVIIAGIAEGFYSVWVPIVVVGMAIMFAFGFCTGFDYADPQLFALGVYGVAISAVGMLSTLGITLATDAYGPIADNAGGNAEMSGQDPSVRERTDALDSLGNTTAATGKGFAIGSAALTALALLAAYVEEVRVGMDRWAEDFGDAVAVSTSLEDASVVKVGRNVVGVITAEGEHPEPWLLISRVRPEKGSAMANMIAAEVGQGVTGVNLVELSKLGFVVANHKATIPDYTAFYDVTIMNPKVLVGAFMGVMLAFVFCAMTMKAVGRAAGKMVEEVRRQFREIPGIMEGTGEPEYATCVAISTSAAQKEMLLPSLLGLVVPILVGLVLGVAGVMGMLAGGLTSGFAVAIMMANSGGAWDNAKKYIESGAHGGKGTDVHKATVVGDTVGDPFKDTSGPSLNILIKLMSMVSVVFAGLVVKYSLSNFF